MLVKTKKKNWKTETITNQTFKKKKNFYLNLSCFSTSKFFHNFKILPRKVLRARSH